jgi:hypothetical protein
LYKEVAKWLFELTKPLLVTAAVALGVLIAGQMNVFGVFLTDDIKLNRYQLWLWILLEPVLNFCQTIPRA